MITESRSNLAGFFLVRSRAFWILLENSGDPKNFNKLSFIRFTYSLSLKIFGQVAQSVEQRPEKPCVASSILALSTELIFYPLCS